MENIFNITRYQINMAALIFYLAFPFSVFIANYVNDNVGIKLGMTIGNITLILGTGIRLFINEGFYFVLIG